MGSLGDSLEIAQVVSLGTVWSIESHRFILGR